MPQAILLRRVEGVYADIWGWQFVKQEDLNKYRCKVPDCTKLFKGPDFWRKHVEKRHPEFYVRVQSDIELVNTYVLDPAHIAPSRSDANSNGHFPLGNNMPAGTPRGFQLPQHMGGMMGMPPNMIPPNAMAQQMFQGGMMPGWNPPMMGGPMPGMGMQGGIGPVRNHGGGRGMNNGYAGGGGRMAPYGARPDRRMPSMSGGRGMPGIEGGGAGPQEAVMGRKIVPYGDLDAANEKDSGPVELDY